MLKRLKLLFLCFLVLNLYSCSNQPTKKAKNNTDELSFVKKDLIAEAKADKILPAFKTNYLLKGRTWLFNENNFLINPYAISCDSKENLVLIDLTNKFNFKYINIRQNDTIISFGIRGKAPMELGQAVQIISMDADSLSVWDSKKQIIFNYSLKDVRNGKKSASSYQRLRNKNNRFYRVLPLTKNEFLCTGYFLNTSLLKFDNKDSSISNLIDYPFAKQYQKSRAALPIIMQSEIFMHKNYLLSVFGHTPVMRVFNKTDKLYLVKQIQGDDPKILPVIIGDIVASHPKADNIYGFLSPYLSDNYFIAPYSGRTPKDYPKSDKVFFSDHLLVYDWQANPLFALTIDEDCSAITYDEQHKVLYTVARNDNSEPHIREYHVDIEKLINSIKNDKN